MGTINAFLGIFWNRPILDLNFFRDWQKSHWLTAHDLENHTADKDVGSFQLDFRYLKLPIYYFYMVNHGVCIRGNNVNVIKMQQ